MNPNYLRLASCLYITPQHIELTVTIHDSLMPQHINGDSVSNSGRNYCHLLRPHTHCLSQLHTEKKNYKAAHAASIRSHSLCHIFSFFISHTQWCNAVRSFFRFSLISFKSKVDYWYSKLKVASAILPFCFYLFKTRVSKHKLLLRVKSWVSDYESGLSDYQFGYVDRKLQQMFPVEHISLGKW